MLKLQNKQRLSILFLSTTYLIINNFFVYPTIHQNSFKPVIFIQILTLYLLLFWLHIYFSSNSTHLEKQVKKC